MKNLVEACLKKRFGVPIIFSFFFIHALIGKDLESLWHTQDTELSDEQMVEKRESMQQEHKNVFKFSLKNGLTVLVVPIQGASQVAAQIWYKVGSKDESFGERGMAHFIEHMVFKGTNEMLSESDVNMLGSKLSAYVNAGTWYDFTFYYFTLPLANWSKVLPVFADWMENCRFNQDHMDSEVKAVIQELKMANDQYSRFLMWNLISAIFDSHPYHYSVIGYKQDLWNLKRDTLLNFYKKHYIPQNATLILVGDLDPEKAYEKVCEYFADIPRGEVVAPAPKYHNEDVVAKKIVFYRDVEQAIGMLAFVTSGMQEKTAIVVDVLTTLLANGKSSRLYKKLVDEMGLVSEISASGSGTYDHDIFHIVFKPIREHDFDKIRALILEEIENIVEHGITDLELFRAIKNSQIAKQQKFEHVGSLAQELGWNYLATGDEQFLFENLEGKEEQLRKQVLLFLKKYFRASQCHEGRICKISHDDKKYLDQLQKNTAESDGLVLAEKERESVVEAPKYVNTVSGEKTQKKEFLKPEVYALSNGLEIILCKTNTVDTVSCLLQMRADDSYTPVAREGSLDLVYKMMIEGTKSYPGLTFAQQAESYGMDFTIKPGTIACEMLACDTVKGFDFVRSMIQEASFDQQDFERIKEKQKALITAFWDEPRNIRMQVAKDLVYKGHPYSKCLLGTEQSIQKIDRDYCFELYKKYISPCGARLIVVGNFNQETIKQDIYEAFALWTGHAVDALEYPVLKHKDAEQICIEKNRDQVFMAFVGLSVPRLDPSYDALLVYDQILAGSSLGSMDTLLFRLREQTGLFYTASGSVIMGADQEPGMIYIATMVAPDRVEEAHKVFMDTLTKSVDSITDDEFDSAKENIITAFCNKYDTNTGKALMFDFLRKYNLPFDYFEQRFDSLRNLSKKSMIKAVKKLLKKENISCIKIGKWSQNSKDKQ